VRAPGVSRVRGGGGGVPEPEPGERGPAGAALPTKPAALVRPAPQPGSGLVFEHFGPHFLITPAVNLPYFFRYSFYYNLYPVFNSISFMGTRMFVEGFSVAVQSP
jgi:hypothetical protein